MIIKCISGAQSGSDIAGIKAAKTLGIETGGWIPAGYRSEYTPKSELYTFNLKETKSNSYPIRTRLNVRDADITLIFGDDKSPGCTLTKRCCRELDKPYVLIPSFSNEDFIKCYQEITKLQGNITCNVAGNRENSFPGIEVKTKEFCMKLFKKVNELND